MKDEAGRKIEKGKENIQQKSKTSFETAKDLLKNTYHKAVNFITGKGKVDLGDPEDNFEGGGSQEVLNKKMPKRHQKVDV